MNKTELKSRRLLSGTTMVIPLLSLALSMPNALGITTVTTKPDTKTTAKTTVTKQGRYTTNSSKTSSGIESKIGTPAHAINILNGTLSNRIDSRVVVEHVFLVGKDDEVQTGKSGGADAKDADAGSHDLLTGKDDQSDSDKNSQSASTALGQSSQSDGSSAHADDGKPKEKSDRTVQKNKSNASTAASSMGGDHTAAAGDGSGGQMGYAGSVPSTLTEASDQLKGVIQNNYKNWLGTNGKLSLPDMNNLVSDPKYKGQEAAALGALTVHLAGAAQKNASTLTSASALTKEQLAAMGKEALDGRLVRQYKAAMEQISKDVSKDGLSLWGKANTPPSLDEIHQWADQDCYLVSAVGALVQKDPQALVNMIKQNGPESFTVQFPGHAEPVPVKLTQAQVALFSHTVKGGCWLAVLGLAEAKVLDETNQPTRTQISLGDVISAGDNVRTYTLLTGKDYTSLNLNKNTAKAISRILTKANKLGEIVGVSNKSQDYTVLGWDSKGQELTFWNPAQGQLTAVEEAQKSSGALPENAESGEWKLNLTSAIADGLNDITVPKALVSPKAARTAGISFMASPAAAGPNTAAAAQHPVSMPNPTAQANAGGAAERLATSAKVPSTASTINTVDAGLNQLDVANTNLQNLDKNAHALETANGEKSDTNQAVLKPLPEYLQRTRFHGNEVHMGQGSILIAHESKIVVHAESADINIAPYACAYIVQYGKDLAIYNLGDSHKGDITAVLKDKTLMPVQMGRELVLSPTESEFAKANPQERIKFQNVKNYGDHHGTHAFEATFAPVSALDNTPQFEHLIASSRNGDKLAAERILKTMAALLAAAGGN